MVSNSRKPDNALLRAQEEANRIATKQHRVLTDMARALKSGNKALIEMRKTLEEAMKGISDARVELALAKSADRAPAAHDPADHTGPANHTDPALKSVAKIPAKVSGDVLLPSKGGRATVLGHAPGIQIVPGTVSVTLNGERVGTADVKADGTADIDFDEGVLDTEVKQYAQGGFVPGHYAIDHAASHAANYPPSATGAVTERRYVDLQDVERQAAE